MRFPGALIRGKLVKRYKRFLADVTLDNGKTVTVTCPNTGSMKGLCDPGMMVWLSTNDNPKRKYRHTWELVEAGFGKDPVFVGINTGHPNRLVQEAIEAARIGSLRGYAALKREQKYGQNSRIDILLDDDRKGRAYVEIKNVHLMRKQGCAEFPDSVTERGAKHLRELADMVDEGHRAVMVYLVQREDATRFSLAEDIDPAYRQAFDEAMDRGVEAMAYRCQITLSEIVLTKKIPIRL